VVGNCDPPKEHQFKKGQSGNPNGRIKGRKTLKTIIRDLLEKQIEYEPTKGQKITAKGGEALIHTMLIKAVGKNDVAAAKLLIEHLEGKPVQSLEIKEKTLNEVMREHEELQRIEEDK